MNNIVRSCLAAAVCAATPLGTAYARDCPVVCWIDVHVVDDGAGGKKLDIEDNGDVRMPRTFRWVAVVWTVRTPGYEFRGDGITPFVGRATPGKERTSRGVWNSQITSGYASRWDQYYLWNLNSVPATMYYNIKVYPVGGGTPIVLDPAIINDP